MSVEARSERKVISWGCLASGLMVLGLYGYYVWSSTSVDMATIDTRESVKEFRYEAETSGGGIVSVSTPPGRPFLVGYMEVAPGWAIQGEYVNLGVNGWVGSPGKAGEGLEGMEVGELTQVYPKGTALYDVGPVNGGIECSVQAVEIERRDVHEFDIKVHHSPCSYLARFNLRAGYVLGGIRQRLVP